MRLRSPLAVRFAVAALALFPLSGHLHGQFGFNFDEETKTWSLDNRLVEARFQLNPQGHFVFRGFSHALTGDDWTASGEPLSPIRLRVDRRWIDVNTVFRLAHHSTRLVTRRGNRQIIELDEEQGPGRVILELEMYLSQPVLRYRISYENRQASPLWVDQADALHWSFSGKGETFRSFRVNQWVNHGRLGNFEPLETQLNPAGVPVAASSGADAQHVSWLVIRDSQDRGVFLGWEFDGRATVEACHLATSDTLATSMQIPELNRLIGEGERFQAPWAFVGLFHGDWDEAGYQTQRFTEGVLAQRPPDNNFPYVVWDSWKYDQDIHEDSLRRNAEIAARIGIELFVVDLGWAQHIGHWREDPRKFPSGLRSLSDYVHSLGMKFGLHFALAEAAQQSPVLRFNPDWTSSNTYGYFEALSICLGHQPVRDWLVEEAVRMIGEYNVDWILQDGENMVKHCTKRTHTHDPRDSNYANSVNGLNAVVAAIQARRPRTLWENCEDGGNMMTFNMVRRYVTSIAADDSGDLTTRQAVFGITYPFSPRYADRYMPHEEINQYITRSYMFGGPWIFMNRLEQMAPEQLELAADEIALYKRIRSRFRNGRVMHLTARPNGRRLDAIGHYSPTTDSATIFAYRPETTTRTLTLRLPVFQPDKSYRVTFQEDSRVLTFTGQQLRDGALRVTLPYNWTAEIVYIDPVSNGG